MAFNPIDVELVKDSSDIVSIIQHDVELKRSGNSWKGLCPFHKEKTPSFFVFPAKGTWKCFGCGEGGDVISFLMKQRNLNFLEVVEELAEQSGISLNLVQPSNKSKAVSTTLYEVVSEAQNFYSKCFEMAAGEVAREYLKRREIDESCLKIGIGYAPGRNALLSHLRTKNYSISVMAEAGLIVADRGDPYDRFRDRLTFPIRDRRGRVVSFGARAMGDASPKYLNGPETSIYKKGTFLYGYSTALKGARESGMVILVEGYFDHARLLSIGLSGTVATSGTALTEKQARNLKGMSDNILICYDGDAAGSKAAVKAAEILLAQGEYPRIVRIPGGMDPDDYVIKEGDDSFRELISSAVDPVSFCISLLAGKTPEGPDRIKIAKRLLEVVSSASNSLIEEDLKKKVERYTGYSRNALSRAEDEIRNSRIPRTRRSIGAGDTIDSGDRGILRAATVAGRLDREFIRFLRDDDMTSALAVKILSALRKQIELGYSVVVFPELDEEIAGDCVDIVGALDSITTEQIEKLKVGIEMKRRVIPRRRELRLGLANADSEQKAITLEELADGGIIHERS